MTGCELFRPTPGTVKPLLRALSNGVTIKELLFEIKDEGPLSFLVPFLTGLQRFLSRTSVHFPSLRRIEVKYAEAKSKGADWGAIIRGSLQAVVNVTRGRPWSVVVNGKSLPL